MKKGFQYFVAIWFVLFAIFNVLAFASNPEKDGSFWIGYIMIILAYALQLGCGYFAFKADNLQKLFYGITLAKTAYSGLIAVSIFGFIGILIADFPIGISIALCFLAIAFTAISILKSSAAIEAVEAIDEKVKAKTFFIKSLTVDANTVLSQATSDVAKAEANKVYEAIRYSDPMSSDALAPAESQITLKFNDFKEAILANDEEKIPALAKELIILVEDRNNKCKLLK